MFNKKALVLVVLVVSVAASTLVGAANLSTNAATAREAGKIVANLQREMRQGEVAQFLSSNGLLLACATGNSFWCVEHYMLADGTLNLQYTKRTEPDYRYIVTNGWLQAAWLETNGTNRVMIELGHSVGRKKSSARKSLLELGGMAIE